MGFNSLRAYYLSAKAAKTIESNPPENKIPTLLPFLCCGFLQHWWEQFSVFSQSSWWHVSVTFPLGRLNTRFLTAAVKISTNCVTNFGLTWHCCKPHTSDSLSALTDKADGTPRFASGCVKPILPELFLQSLSPGWSLASQYAKDATVVVSVKAPWPALSRCTSSQRSELRNSGNKLEVLFGNSLLNAVCKGHFGPGEKVSASSFECCQGYFVRTPE